MDINLEKLEYLLQFEEDYTSSFIIKALKNDSIDAKNFALTAYKIINNYISLMKSLNISSKIKSVKEYFSFNAYTKKEYELFCKKICVIEKNTENLYMHQEKNTDLRLSVKEFLCDFDKYIVEFIYLVLNDNSDDPDWSAVAAINMIKCYIDIESEIGVTLPYKNVRGFFEYYGFNQEQYTLFETMRSHESGYYRGVQF